MILAKLVVMIVVLVSVLMTALFLMVLVTPACLSGTDGVGAGTSGELHGSLAIRLRTVVIIMVVVTVMVAG